MRFQKCSVDDNYTGARPIGLWPVSCYRTCLNEVPRVILYLNFTRKESAATISESKIGCLKSAEIVVIFFLHL
jgi:hypothetical protein